MIAYASQISFLRRYGFEVRMMHRQGEVMSVRGRGSVVNQVVSPLQGALTTALPRLMAGRSGQALWQRLIFEGLR